MKTFKVTVEYKVINVMSVDLEIKARTKSEAIVETKLLINDPNKDFPLGEVHELEETIADMGIVEIEEVK